MYGGGLVLELSGRSLYKLYNCLTIMLYTWNKYKIILKGNCNWKINKYSRAHIGIHRWLNKWGQWTHVPYKRIPSNLCRYSSLWKVELKSLLSPDSGPYSLTPQSTMWGCRSDWPCWPCLLWVIEVSMHSDRSCWEYVPLVWSKKKDIVGPLYPWVLQLQIQPTAGQKIYIYLRVLRCRCILCS